MTAARLMATVPPEPDVMAEIDDLYPLAPPTSHWVVDEPSMPAYAVSSADVKALFEALRAAGLQIAGALAPAFKGLADLIKVG